MFADLCRAPKKQIRTLLEREREQILADCQAEIRKHEFQADYDRRSIPKLNETIESQNEEICRVHQGDERRRQDQQLLHEQLLKQNRDVCEAHEKSLNEMKELKRFQGSTFDTIARRKLVEDQDTILELIGKIQELQNMNDSRDFQDAESVRSGHSHVASQPVSFPPHPVPGGMLSRSIGMPSRIDMPFLNPMAARLLNDVHVHEVPEYGIKLHKPRQVNLDFCGTREFAYATPKIRGIPMITHKMSAEDIEQLGNEIMDRHALRFFKSWEIGNVDAVWEDWCQLAESFFVI